MRIWLRKAVGVGLAVLAVAVFGATPASAKEARLPLSPIGSFGEPRGLAVDQASGDVYTIDGRNERQQIAVAATGGKFKLRYEGAESPELSFNAGPEAVRDALRNIVCGGVACLSVPSGGGNETGSNPYEVGFGGPLESTDLPQIECESSPTEPLTGGSPTSACTVTTTVNGVNGQVVRYHANGTPASFSALGSNSIDGRGTGDETPQVGLRFSSLSKEAQVAVDESGGATAGDIYVTQARDRVVDVFAPTGAYLGQLSEYEETPGNAATLKKLVEPCGVAVDPSNGNVFVGDFSSTIHKYAPAANPVANTDTAANLALSEVCNLALGAGPTAGALFALRFGGALFKLDATTGTSECEVSTANTTVTVDPASGHVLTATGSSVKEFDASSCPASELHPPGLAAGSTVNGIAVKGSSGDLYLSRSGATHLDVYGPWVVVPDVAGTGTDEVLGTSATLTGTISAAGGPTATCEFQYLPKATYESQKAAAEAALESPVAVAEAAFGGAQAKGCIPAGPFTGTSTEAVSAHVEGLTPETAYEFRLLGKNANGQIGSAPPAGFETLGKPEVSGCTARTLSTSEASLSCEVDPGGQETTTSAQYVTKAQFEASGFSGAETVAGPTVPAGAPEAVSIQISGLTLKTEYVTRMVAHNPSGTTEGSEEAFTTFGVYPPPPEFPPCENEALRTEAGARLPDCRAYEQVSPLDKHGANAIGNPNFSQAAADGHAAVFGSYATQETTGGTSHAPAYVASRGSEGWSYDGALPPTGPGFEAGELGRDEELGTSIAAVKEESDEEGSLWSTDLQSFARTPLLALPHWGRVAPNPQLAEDTEVMSFEDEDALAAGAVAGKPNLYELDHGALSLLGMVPVFPETSCGGGAEPACVPAPGGSFAGSYDASGIGNLQSGGTSYRQHTLSRDGQEVFFTEAGSGRLFMRRGGSETIQLSAPTGPPDPNGHKPAQWLGATPTGSAVFFASCEKLTAGSTAVSTAANTCLSGEQGQDLYEYDTASEELSDLTVDPNVSDAHGAQVLGMLGASPDGTYLYFAANGVLGAGASAGDCEVSGGTLSGQCSLYLRHGGATTFVARLGGNGANETFSDNLDWAPGQPKGSEPSGYEKTARVAADGTLLFSSTLPLTAYDNASPDPESSCSPTHGAGPCAELYRYAPGDAEPSCVSCNPTGAPPLGNATLVSDPKNGVGILQASHPAILTRNLSSDGKRVFFETPDRLVGADVNGLGGCQRLAVNTVRACQDVYEWEAQGTGSCETSEEDGGCLYLLSTGMSDQPSFFGDADESGENAFLFTYSQLVPQDRDSLSDLYDARVGGGIPAQHAVSPPPCEAEACRAGGTSPGASQSAGSAGFQGPGNPPAKKRGCPKGKVRRHGRCVAKHHHRKKHHHHHHHRAAAKNGRAGR